MLPLNRLTSLPKEALIKINCIASLMAALTKKENLLITGPTGTGKSFIASALGHQACLLGLRVLYTNTARLLAQLKMARADGSVMKEMIRIEKQDLLIFDDFGIQPFEAISRSCLLEIIEDRHAKHSTIFTLQAVARCDW